jgi:hypothetical protein
MWSVRVIRRAAAAIVVAACFPPVAAAAFPGRNGLLAVQPASGGGIVLVSPDGRGTRRICTGCTDPAKPRWSPDGRELVLGGHRIRIVYGDGSCLNCRFGRAADPAFEPGGTLISFVEAGPAGPAPAPLGRHRAVLGPGRPRARRQRARLDRADALDDRPLRLAARRRLGSPPRRPGGAQRGRQPAINRIVARALA